MAFDNIFDQNRRTRDAIASPANQRAKDMSQARGEFRAEGKLFTDFPNRTAYDQALYNRAQSYADSRSTPQGAAPVPTVAKPSDIPESVFSGANAAADRRFNPPLFNNPQQPLGTPARTPFSVSQMPFGNPQVPYNSFSPLASSPNVGTSGFSRTIGGYGDQAGKVNTTEQTLSPFGFASSTFTPDQLNQRSQARQQAQESGTMPRTPEQQQALLAQMRTSGAAIGRDIVNRNEEVFAAKREERKLANSLDLDMGSDYYKNQPSSIAGIQRDFKNYQGAGVNNMTKFVQGMIDEEAKSKKKGKYASASRSVSPYNPTSISRIFETPLSAWAMAGSNNPFNSNPSAMQLSFPQGNTFGGTFPQGTFSQQLSGF